MHPTAMATFDRDCNQLKANVDRDVGEALSSAHTCDLLAAHLQEKLNEFETNLQCELSSIFIKFSIIAGHEAAIAHVIRNHQLFARSADVDVHAVQAESILKIGQLFDCSHRFIGKKYDAEHWEYRKTAMIGDIKLVKFKLSTELYAEVTQIFGRHLTGLREVSKKLE